MNNWSSLLKQEKLQPYFLQTIEHIERRRAQGITVFPPQAEVFSAFDTPAFDDIKVVILGQDPYHGEGQAHGLSFSVKPGVKVPPSLKNIYKELANDVSDFEIPEHGLLQAWADQGVMLLNTVLTVEEGQAHSHKHLGWEQFTDHVIASINEQLTGVVFLLWGAHAQKKGKAINTKIHHVLLAPHPSPLSAHRGFFGCQHFSKTNKLLISLGKSPIDWQV
ncbi:uracil-DNA glycosylase [Thalassotalea atypica]|uniref:uracil-DNA glycosylase n=1 Tax=Thalassotalea atypica TaxID=2054316 RepID=UPI0025735BB4|nr:uracil-DNA glycosylase [Thalassotalea atypica]